MGTLERKTANSFDSVLAILCSANLTSNQRRHDNHDNMTTTKTPTALDQSNNLLALAGPSASNQIKIEVREQPSTCLVMHSYELVPSTFIHSFHHSHLNQSKQVHPSCELARTTNVPGGAPAAPSIGPISYGSGASSSSS
jgi:hypothetical protein